MYRTMLPYLPVRIGYEPLQISLSEHASSVTKTVAGTVIVGLLLLNKPMLFLPILGRCSICTLLFAAIQRESPFVAVDRPHPVRRFLFSG
jgi:hypothetical protein